MKYTAKLPEENVNVSKTSPVREFLVLSGGLLGLIALGYFLLGAAVGIVAPRVPVSLEKKMAPVFMGMVHDDADKAAGLAREQVQALVDRINGKCAHLPYDFTVHIQKSPIANAFALPGGNIVVFTGLLTEVGSENELAFVLGHELGHYANRDHLKGLGRSMVLVALTTALFGPDSSVNTMMSGALNLTEMRFSRGQETLADDFGMAALSCLYGHAGGATDFFKKIEEFGPSRFGHYFSTHPENRRRIEHIRALAVENHLADRDTIPLSFFFPDVEGGEKKDQ